MSRRQKKLTNKEISFASIGVDGLRVERDGDGITTLVAGAGCPLRCRYCPNPQCFRVPLHTYTLTELLDEVSMDNLYFQATGGGVTFGGGEPLLQAAFIHEFCSACPSEWHICLESSLAVPRENLEMVLDDIDQFIIDIKDMNPEIYRAYTGQSNEQTIENLKLLITRKDPECIKVRIPRIPSFNTKADQARSSRILKEMGFTNFEFFEYDTDISNSKR